MNKNIFKEKFSNKTFNFRSLSGGWILFEAYDIEYEASVGISGYITNAMEFNEPAIFGWVLIQMFDEPFFHFNGKILEQ